MIYKFIEVSSWTWDKCETSGLTLSLGFNIYGAFGVFCVFSPFKYMFSQAHFNCDVMAFSLKDELHKIEQTLRAHCTGIETHLPTSYLKQYFQRLMSRYHGCYIT